MAKGVLLALRVSILPPALATRPYDVSSAAPVESSETPTKYTYDASAESQLTFIGKAASVVARIGSASGAE